MIEETNEVCSMSQLREAVIKGREAFHREWSRGRPVGSFLLLGAAVVIGNLLFVYERHSLRDVIIVVVVLMVLYPLIGYWRYSKNPR
jgi:hypothetical protein